jgi:hypothetical protein
LAFLLPRSFKLFGFPDFWLGDYMMEIISETRRGRWIKYLCLYWMAVPLVSKYFIWLWSIEIGKLFRVNSGSWKKPIISLNFIDKIIIDLKDAKIK